MYFCFSLHNGPKIAILVGCAGVCSHEMPNWFILDLMIWPEGQLVPTGTVTGVSDEHVFWKGRQLYSSERYLLRYPKKQGKFFSKSVMKTESCDFFLGRVHTSSGYFSIYSFMDFFSSSKHSFTQ